MIMRESLYKDAHPLHKVSEKIFYFIFLREIFWLKIEKNKEKKKVPRKKKRRVGGGSPLTIISSKKMPVRGAGRS